MSSAYVDAANDERIANYALTAIPLALWIAVFARII